MELIDKFKNIPKDVYLNIISYLPVRSLNYSDCIDQIKNMSECLEDYKQREIRGYSVINKWLNWSYQKFAFHKIKNKKLLNGHKTIRYNDESTIARIDTHQNRRERIRNNLIRRINYLIENIN